VPPDGNTCTVPLQGAPKALQLAGVALYVAVRVAQSPLPSLVTIAVKAAIQPFESVISEEYVPAHIGQESGAWNAAIALYGIGCCAAAQR